MPAEAISVNDFWDCFEVSEVKKNILEDFY